MKIAVIGAGAIGGLVAGYLKKEDQDITLIAKKSQADVINKNGLSIEGVRGSFKITLPVKDKLDEPIDLIILAVKTQDIEEVINKNIPLIKNTKILTTQNGLKAEEILSKYVQPENIFSSIVMFGATYLETGKVVHNFEGDLIIGKFFNGSKEFLNEISQITSQAFSTKIVDNIKGMKWTKLFINMNNCLPAILGKSMQDVFADIENCKISIRLWKEAKELTDKAGIKLENLPNFPVERISGLINMPLEQAAGIYSGIMTNLSKEPLYGSILQSIKRNRPSEVDYINGEVVKLAESINSDAPLNRKMTELVHKVEDTKEFLTSQNRFDLFCDIG